MKHAVSISLALALAFTPFVSGCDPKDAHTGTEPVAPVAVPAPPKHEPTAERALLRATERWQKGIKSDWVAVYEYAAPSYRRERPLGAFLQDMQVHRYENMRVEEVVAVQGNNAFLRVSGLWTPIGAPVAKVKLDPGQSLTQEFTMIETWIFADGDWCHFRSQRDTEFFGEHPDLLKKSAAAPEPAK